MGSAIETPDGPVLVRKPSEAEAIAIEDKRRHARRPRSEGEQVVGAAYDDGRAEILGCILSPSRDALEADDGILELYPGVLDRALEAIRDLGGYNLSLQPDEDAAAPHRPTYKRRALGFTYGPLVLCARRMTEPEYSAFMANRTSQNFWSLLAAQGKAALISHQGDEAAALFSEHPYLAMDIGLKLLDRAMGVAEAQQKKSVSGSSDKIRTSQPPPSPCSSPATASAGAG